jgi:hypothetical protein
MTFRQVRACHLLTDYSEFADRYPSTEVIGTDLSPCQPQWIPPNLRFEIDDATQSWTWKENYFNFIHIRYLFGAIKDWNSLCKEAYRCCAPGGWVQSGEADVTFRSDDGTTELEPVFKTYQKLFEDGSQILGNPFFVHDLQQKAFKEAGFTDVKTVDYKVGFSRTWLPLTETISCSSLLEAGPRIQNSPRSVNLSRPHWRTT